MEFDKMTGVSPKIFIGIVFGGLIGYAYFYFIRCRAGTCAITSHSINSIIYGSFMGHVWFWPWKKIRGK